MGNLMNKQKQEQGGYNKRFVEIMEELLEVNRLQSEMHKDILKRVTVTESRISELEHQIDQLVTILEQETPPSRKRFFFNGENISMYKSKKKEYHLPITVEWPNPDSGF